MTEMSAEYKALAEYRPTQKVRFVTAASLFDGHDAAINIMRRILQSMGAEVIHLGHNRSVDEVVTAALQEDAQGIAVSSYQGGHVEYFKYMVELLRQRGGEKIQVFGGGGGVIVPAEIRDLADQGVRIFSPEDGQRMGLMGMIGEMVMRCDQDLSAAAPTAIAALQGHSESAWRALAQAVTALENGKADAGFTQSLREAAQGLRTPVLGITGTGGAGKSSLTDELIRRLRLDQDDALRIAVISIDPSRRKSGGALLGDRIRMNAIAPWSAGQRVYMRSLATRDFGSEISQALPDVIAAAKVSGVITYIDRSTCGTMAASPWPMPEVSTITRSNPATLQAAITSGSACEISEPASRVASERMKTRAWPFHGLIAFMRMRSPSRAPPDLRRDGSIETTAMFRRSPWSRRMRRISSSVSEDLPAPPVPVMPSTGTFMPSDASMICLRSSFEALPFSSAVISWASGRWRWAMSPPVSGSSEVGA